MASDAVGIQRVSRIVGYVFKAGDFRPSSPNLPQRVALFGEANTANQTDLVLDPVQITSLEQVGALFGYGSPIYLMARILFPNNGDGLGGVPVFVYPQEEPVGATSKKIEITPSGVATGNGTHIIKIAGRDGVDGQFYEINIENGDSVSDITQKIEDAVNKVLGSPVSASSTSYAAELETKWKGLTAEALVVEVDTGDNDLGIAYVVNSTQAGSGTPSVQDALDKFGTVWNTWVINGYGTVSTVLNTLQTFNGIPLQQNPTGRYRGIVMKPFIAITGSVADDPSSVTDARKDEVTIAIAPAPLSQGFQFEAAANMCVLAAVVAQNTPELDVCGMSYPDMPTPLSIGSMAVYDNRDTIVQKGCSTVDLVAGRYQVQDFVTTYHKDGQNPPNFRYCRNLMLDFNIRYTYYLLEQINVVDHVIANDTDVVLQATKVVKPKQWKNILRKMAEDLVNRGLISDADFTKASISVGISTQNPDRFETEFKYKRTSIARISATTATAGFNYGTI